MAACILLVALAYVAVAGSVYRFAHPEMTETELFLHLWDALRWRP